MSEKKTVRVPKEGVFQDSRGDKMPEKSQPIPVNVQRRLVRVLSHLAENRKSACEGALHHSTCSSGGGADIEDLTSSLRSTSADYLDEKEDVLFDPERYKVTQQPLLEATMIHPEAYNSPKWFRREMERAFMPSWSLVGREDEVAEPGKYLAIDTEWGGPVAVVRGNDGELHAFANVCAHRGAKIVQDGLGKAPKGGLICPYHAWTYDYGGNLLIAPGMNKTLDFDEDNIQLAPVRLDTLHGFIFVNHSKEAKPLTESLGDLPEKLGEWFGPDGAVKNMVCAGRRTYEVPCNWKFIYENTCETYHTSVVHRSSLGPMKSRPMEPHRGDWDGVRVPTERTIVPLPSDFEGDQFPLPAFTDKSCFVNIYPSLQINVTWDCIWWMNTIPTGVASSRIEMGFCFPKQTTQLDVFPSRLERYLHRWNMAVMEDNEISCNQQRGVRSVFRKPGRYCQLEFGTHNFNNWLLSKVLDNSDTAWDPGMRIFKSTQEALWSNDDKQMLQLVEEAVGKGGDESNPKRVLVSSPVVAGGDKVCVTGATGFIGLHVVKQLLERSCHVTAAVRNISDKRKMAPLLAMQAAGPGVLRIIGGCEVLTPGSFDEAVADCEVCFHLASPFWMDDRITDPHKELVEPAEQGSVNILRSCMKAPTMRRVVVTSSFGAVMNVGGNNPWPMDFHYLESHWNSSSAPVNGVFPEPRNVHAYRWSKTAAEKAVWDFAATQKPHFDVTCICPPMVLGPNLQKLTSTQELNQSSLLLFKMLAGQMKFANPGSVGFADVRDVARAHILAADTPGASSQRYLCSGVTQTWLDVSRKLRDIFPNRPIPTSCEDGQDPQPCMLLNNSKIQRELRMHFTPLEDTLREQGQALIDAGLLG